VQGVIGIGALSGSLGRKGKGARGRPRGVLKRTRRRSPGRSRRTVTQTSKQLHGGGAHARRSTPSGCVAEAPVILIGSL